MKNAIDRRPRGAVPLSKREANKLEKISRIRDAAHELFVLRGYDSATMRDIAAQAGVALGTLFLYASNKRDLLFLIANETMEDAVEQSAALVKNDQSLLSNLTIIAGVHFKIFGSQPELFRLVLRELLFFDLGEQGVRAVVNRSRLLSLIDAIIANATETGEVSTSTDSELAAKLMFAILQAEIRSWIAAKDLDLATGLSSFSRMVGLSLVGVSLKDAAIRLSRADINRLLIRLGAANQPARRLGRLPRGSPSGDSERRPKSESGRARR